MGTPEFAVPALRRLTEAGRVPVCVYTQPARRKGRGLAKAEPPVATEARRLGLDVRQPEILQTRSELAHIQSLRPDLIVTAAYGKIFRRRLLFLPRLGCINLHPSLLPRHRGLSPVQRAILEGDALTGVTVYRMTEGVDSGPIIAQRCEPVRPDDTGGSLMARLAGIGAEVLVEAVSALESGSASAVEQDENLATYAPRLEKHHGLIDWRLPAEHLWRMVRAFQPWPGTFTFHGSLRVKVLAVEPETASLRCGRPGEVLAIERDTFVVASLPGSVRVLEVQPAGSRAQSGGAFARGRRLRPGDFLTGEPSSPSSPSAGSL